LHLHTCSFEEEEEEKKKKKEMFMINLLKQILSLL